MVETRLMAMLVLADAGLRPIRRIPLDERRKLTIGRSPERDLIISDPEISRLHCVVYSENGSWCIADAGSSGGTYVDHERVIWKRLKAGRVARIGGIRLWIDEQMEEPEASNHRGVASEPRIDPATWDLRPDDEPSGITERVPAEEPEENISAFLSGEKDYLQLEPEPAADEQI